MFDCSSSCSLFFITFSTINMTASGHKDNAVSDSACNLITIPMMFNKLIMVFQINFLCLSFKMEAILRIVTNNKTGTDRFFFVNET